MNTIIASFGRTGTILIAGALATVCSFYVMQLMVAEKDIELGTPSPKVNINISIPVIDIKPIHETPTPEKIEIPEPPPMIERNYNGNEIVPIYSGPPTIKKIEEPGNEFLIGPSDGTALPIAQVQPVYPNTAISRNIEGFVVVEFDINENGSVINPKVLYAEPSSIFNRAALQAIDRWKYNPKIQNGQAVVMRGIQQKFIFSLDD